MFTHSGSIRHVHNCEGHVQTVDTKDQSNAIVY